MFWKIITKEKKNTGSRVFTYSATGEITQTDFITDINIKNNITDEIYVPPQSYYGIGCYIRDERVHKNIDFFKYIVKPNEEDDELELTDQGNELIKNLRGETKKVGTNDI